MATDLATLAELQARLGLPTLNANDTGRAQGLIDDISALALVYGDSTWTYATVPAAAKTIVLSAAVRGYRNPGGALIQTGDFQYAQVSGDSAGYLTDKEKSTLGTIAGRSGLSSLSLITGVGGILVPTNYSDNGLAGDPMSWA